MTEEFQAQIEAAFREGYQEGYNNGESDQASYDFGSGSKHSLSRRNDQDEAWKYSDTFASTMKHRKIE